jgi:hypothetical protein
VFNYWRDAVSTIGLYREMALPMSLEDVVTRVAKTLNGRQNMTSTIPAPKSFGGGELTPSPPNTSARSSVISTQTDQGTHGSPHMSESDDEAAAPPTADPSARESSTGLSIHSPQEHRAASPPSETMGTAIPHSKTDAVEVSHERDDTVASQAASREPMAWDTFVKDNPKFEFGWG